MEKSQGLREAYALIKAGQKQQAVQILEQMLRHNPADTEAFALLSLAVDDPEKRRECLNTILRLSSDEKALAWARQQLVALPVSESTLDIFRGDAVPAANPQTASKPQPAQRFDLYLVLAGVAVIAVIIIGGVIAFPLLRQRLAAPTVPTAPAIQASQPARPTAFLFATSTATATPTDRPTPTERATATPTDSPTFTPGPTATLTDAQAHFEKGYTLYWHLWRDKALVEFNTALSLDPNLVEAYVVRARLYMYEGRPDKANADMLKAQQLAPEDRAVMLLPGDIASLNGDHLEALAIYNRVIEIYPDYARAYFVRSLTYLDLGDSDKALADANKAIKLDPASLDAINTKANILYDRREYTTACSLYSQAIAIDPEHPIPYGNLGNCLLWGSGDLVLASYNYEKALELFPDLDNAHFGRGHIFYFHGEYGKALEEYNIADRLGISRSALYGQRGLTYSHLQNYQRALTDFTNMLQYSSSPCLYNNLCQAYNGVGDYQSAIANCTISINSGGPTHAYFNRAVAYDQRGDKSNALRDYQIFLQYYPADSEETDYARERVEALGGGTAQPILMCVDNQGGVCGNVQSALAPPTSPESFPHIMCDIY